jgi:hypothetical protein
MLQTGKMPIASPRYPFTQAAIAGAPDDPGVYALFQDQQIVFYGIAVGVATIHSRLLAHLSGTIHPAQATHYAWEIARDPERKRAELLAEHEVLHGRAPIFNRDIAQPPDGSGVLAGGS